MQMMLSLVQMMLSLVHEQSGEMLQTELKWQLVEWLQLVYMYWAAKKHAGWMDAS